MTDIVERLKVWSRDDHYELPSLLLSDCAEAAGEIVRLRAELERERAFKESYHGQLQDIFAKYRKLADKPDGYVGDAPYWKGPSKND